MPIAAILPIKRFVNAKQRLAPALTPDQRARLAQAFASDVMATLQNCPAINDTFVVSGDQTVQVLARQHNLFVVNDPFDEGQSAAVQLGITAAQNAGNDRVLLLPGDCPLVSPEDITQLLCDADPDAIILVPDRHGTGTNTLMYRPELNFRPHFGPDSCARHHQLAHKSGYAIKRFIVNSLQIDVDTPADLSELQRWLKNPTNQNRAVNTQVSLAELTSASH